MTFEAVAREVYACIYNNFIGGLFALVGLVLTLFLLNYRVRSYIRKRRYLVRKNDSNISRAIVRMITKNSPLDKFLSSIAFKVSVLNDNSYEKNKERSIWVLVFLLLGVVVNLIIMFPKIKVIWYLYLFYLILGMIFTLCILYTMELVLRMHFTKLLPGAYKILNSRFTKEEDILKAIDISLVDFDPAIRREMTRISKVLRKNDRDKINDTFSWMEKNYRNEYFTLLLNLIHQAYYKGGKDSIKIQFEVITEEILIDIENQKDLALTSRMYVIISLFLPLGINWMENFNKRALGPASQEFYASPLGVGFKVLLLLSLLIYIVSLLFLERTA